MSLVSYADSDESSDNETIESNEQPSERRTETATGEFVEKVKLLASPIEKNAVPEQSKEKQNDDRYSETTKPKSIGNLFSSLPAPWMSSLTWASKDKTGKSGGKAKRQQTVKISLPVPDETDSDEEPSQADKGRPFTGSQKPSGLSSLLPKPKHSVVVKENNPNRPVAKISNRSLIPDSIRMKQKKAPIPPQHKKQLKKNDSDEDEADNGDEESVSFFSLEEQESSSASISSTGQASDDTPDMNIETRSNQVKPSKTNLSVSYSSSSETNNSSTILGPSLVYENQKAVKSDETSSVEYSHESYSQPTGDLFQGQNSFSMGQPYSNPYSYGETTENQATTYTDEPAAHNQDYSYTTADPYFNYDYDQLQPVTQQGQYGVQWNSQIEPTPGDPSQQFKKLRGKRGRGEENIDIIDVNVDDQVGSSADWKSHYQRQDADYKPQSKKKENLPSSQQRRKHQITYLAFQAKEKEWELRNQWSSNRQTRKQTQSKYGF